MYYFSVYIAIHEATQKVIYLKLKYHACPGIISYFSQEIEITKETKLQYVIAKLDRCIAIDKCHYMLFFKVHTCKIYRKLEVEK